MNISCQFSPKRDPEFASKRDPADVVHDRCWRAGRQAGRVSNDHGSQRPGPRAGVKAREATRVAGLALTPSTDQALAALIWGERTQAVDSGAVLEAPALVAGFDDVAMVSEAVQ